MADPNDDSSGPPPFPIDPNIPQRLASREPTLTELWLNQTLESVLLEYGYESPDEEGEDEQDEEEREAAREQRRITFARERMQPYVNAIINSLPGNTVIRKLVINTDFLTKIVPLALRGAFRDALTRLPALEHFVYYADSDATRITHIPFRVLTIPFRVLTALAENARALKILDVQMTALPSQSDVQNFTRALSSQKESLVSFRLGAITFLGGGIPEGFSLDPILLSLSGMPSIQSISFFFSQTAARALKGYKDCYSDEAFAAMCSISSLKELEIDSFSFNDQRRSVLERLIAGNTLQRLEINTYETSPELKIGGQEEQVLLETLENNFSITDSYLGIVSDEAKKRIKMFCRLNAAGRGNLLRTDGSVSTMSERVGFLAKILHHPLDDIYYVIRDNPAVVRDSRTTDRDRLMDLNIREQQVREGERDLEARRQDLEQEFREREQDLAAREEKLKQEFREREQDLAARIAAVTAREDRAAKLEQHLEAPEVEPNPVGASLNRASDNDEAAW